MASDAANRHPFRLLGALSLVALSLSHLGCTALADRVATRLAEHRVEGLTQGVTVVEGELALYRDCLKNRGGSCSGGAESALPGAREASVSSPARPLAPTVTSSIETLPQGHPARTAHDALEHPFVHKVMGLYNHLRGLDGSSKTPGLEVASRESAGGRESTVRFTTSPSELQDFVDRVHTASIAGGWGALADHSAERARETATSNPKAAKDAHRDARRLAYIRNYLHAYFDDGRFVQVRLETGDLDTRVNQYLARRFPQLCGAGSLEEDCSKLVTDLRDEILRGVATTQDGTAYVFGSVGAAGFVSRSGSTAKFPGFQLSLDPYGAQEASFGIIGNVDYTVIGSDVIRVLLEAIFDAHEGLPAVPSATGAHFTGTDSPYALPIFDPASGPVTQEDFNRIERLSNQVEASTGAAFDRLLRGIGIFSLNNEAIVDLLTTTMSVTVRKAAEKAAWCWYSCEIGGDFESAEARARERAEQFAKRKVEKAKVELRLQ